MLMPTLHDTFEKGQSIFVRIDGSEIVLKLLKGKHV